MTTVGSIITLQEIEVIMTDTIIDANKIEITGLKEIVGTISKTIIPLIKDIAHLQIRIKMTIIVTLNAYLLWKIHP